MSDTPLHVVPHAPSPPGVTPPTGVSGSRLIEVLVELGFVSQERVEAAVEIGQAAGRPAERVLVDQGAISAEQLSRAIAERYGLDYVDLGTFPVDRAAVHLLDAAVATRLGAVPISFVDDRTLLVAIADPANTAALADIETRTRLTARPSVAPAHAITATIAGDPPPVAVAAQSVAVVAVEQPAAPKVVELVEPEAGIAPARDLLSDAVARGATVVHLEQGADGLWARGRIDGSLVPLGGVPAAALDVVKRLERGRYALGGRSVELAVTILDTPTGEAAVVHVRDPDRPRPGLDELGLRRPELERALAGARGVVLIAGTSAVAREAGIEAVRAAATFPERRVIVAGDDLRAARAADPDVLVVAAVRDREAATAALDAGMDGVLVIAGFPAPDPESARLRLHSWGVEAFLIEYALACVVSVRPSPPGLR